MLIIIILKIKAYYNFVRTTKTPLKIKLIIKKLYTIGLKRENIITLKFQGNSQTKWMKDYILGILKQQKKASVITKYTGVTGDQYRAELNY